MLAINMIIMKKLIVRGITKDAEITRRELERVGHASEAWRWEGGHTGL